MLERTKYREERTLARGLCRMPEQSREEFRKNVTRLRRHFETFNRDVSEICQWLMGLRPDEKKRFGENSKPFWEFFLNPESTIQGEDDTTLDRARQKVFDVVAGWQPETTLSEYHLPQDLLDSIRLIAAQSFKATDVSASNLFIRLKGMQPLQRMIVLKSAAEWVYARYQKAMDNWDRQYGYWRDEREKWQKERPALTKDVRGKYNAIFKQLGIERKAPRVCEWKWLAKNRDNCNYNDTGMRIKGEGKSKGHSLLCNGYHKFHKELEADNNEKYFTRNLEDYLNLRLRNQPREMALDSLYRQMRPTKRYFAKMLSIYLARLDIEEDGLLIKYRECRRLPHCTKLDDRDGCEFNPHIEKCRKYKEMVSQLTPEEQKLESDYRKWRKQFLSGPAKPHFSYPSSRELPTAKIFGEGFFKPGFNDSILNLRLEDVPGEEWLRFGFKPWPKDYDMQPSTIEISSIQIHFAGTRAKVGFRFKVAHKTSRFKIAQDDLDELRRVKYPRPSQNSEYLKEARRLLLGNFNPGNPEANMSVLVVDTGTSGGVAAHFVGREFRECTRLKVLKIDESRETIPEEVTEDSLGLRPKHIGFHRDALSEAAKEISKARATADTKGRRYDKRKLVLHTAWMIKDWVRLNASEIIRAANRFGADLIIFESHRNFSVPGYDNIDPDKKQKTDRLTIFSPARIRLKVREKAVERGMLVMAVPEFQSSKRCCKCGQGGEKDLENRRFSCKNKQCGHCGDSDENAARVLERVFWEDPTFDPIEWKRQSDEKKVKRGGKKS